MLEAGKLDKSVPIPLYFQLKQLLLDAIKRGDYPLDGLIPTEKELSEMFQISRTTVRQAITELVQEGWGCRCYHCYMRSLTGPCHIRWLQARRI